MTGSDNLRETPIMNIHFMLFAGFATKMKPQGRTVHPDMLVA
jgi:hypothetical protein